jgi:hypothetical protein
VTEADPAVLLAVQDLDTAIDQHRHRRAHLPERAELEAIDTEAVSLRPEVNELTAARAEIDRKHNLLEAELTATEERANSVSKRLYGGEVSASRELQAMVADVESLRARASSLEDQVLALLEEREPLDKRWTELSHRAAALSSRRRQVVEALGVAETVVDGELAELERERAERVVGIPASLLTTYDQLRAHLGGIGAARLVGNHCDGCHLSLAATELDRIRHLPAGEFMSCEQCGRILIRV